MTNTDFTYDAEVIDWIDGDTVALAVTRTFEMGFHFTIACTYRAHFRLLGVDTPERGQKNHREATKASEGIAPAGTKVKIETHKADKYGRYLATVTTPAGVNVSAQLIALGLGHPYFGGSKAAALAATDMLQAALPAPAADTEDPAV